MKYIHIRFHCFYRTWWKRNLSKWNFASISWCIYLKFHVLWRSLSDVFPMDYLMCYRSVRNFMCVCVSITCVSVLFVCVFMRYLCHSLQRNVFYRLSEKNFAIPFFPFINFKRKVYLFLLNTLVLKHIIQGINTLLYINVMLSAQQVQTHSYEVSCPGVLAVFSRNSISTFSSNICTFFSLN
jgi:hypothetical protein